jgi:hypothetical protein
MGNTTAGLPLRSGEHYEKCPGCATVYRTKRTTRFRCPGCHTLAYAVPVAAGEPGNRRTLEGDDQGRVFRILDERPAAGAPLPKHGDDVVLFLEDPDAPPAAPGIPPSTPPGGPRTRATDAEIAARRERERGERPTGLRALWSGSLGDVFRRG